MDSDGQPSRDERFRLHYFREFQRQANRLSIATATPPGRDGDHVTNFQNSWPTFVHATVKFAEAKLDVCKMGED